MQTRSRPKIRIFSEKIKTAKIRAEVASIDWNEILESSETNYSYKAFDEKYTKVFNKCFPFTPTSRKRVRDKKIDNFGTKVKYTRTSIQRCV